MLEVLMNFEMFIAVLGAYAATAKLAAVLIQLFWLNRGKKD